MSSSSTKMDPQVWGTEEARETAIATLIRYVNEHGRRVQCGYTYNSANGFGLTKVWKLCTDSVEGYRLGLLCIYSNFAKTKESEPQMRSADNVSLRVLYHIIDYIEEHDD